MNISEALIEKYHQGKCTPEEAESIEKWLDDAEEIEFNFPAELTSKETIKTEIWAEVQTFMSERKTVELSSRYQWKYAGMVAAALLAVAGFFYLQKGEAVSKANSTAVAVIDKASPVQTEALKIEFGTESGAVYSKENKMLDFCGVIKITPKENMKLSFTSLCDGNRETLREIDVKAGTTYFAMDLKHQNTSELVIMDKSLVGELPPLLQNSLIAQFGI